jgi:hypothetical protein
MFSERWNGATWHLLGVPAPSGAQSSLLLNVSCAASSCEAVGEYNDSSGATVTLGEQWNGTTWHAQSTPNPARASGNSLSGVSCFVASDCTAVGLGNGAGTPVTVGERWRDGRWRLDNVPSPAGAAENQLNGIACPATDRCVAVGVVGPTRGVVSTEALGWNGRDWRIQPTPNPAGSSSSTLFAVACPAADRCTAVGTSNSKVLAERWDGARWRIQPAPVPPGAQFSELNAVSCTAAAACIAVGDYVTSSGADVTLAERWNGSRPSPSGGTEHGGASSPPRFSSESAASELLRRLPRPIGLHSGRRVRKRRLRLGEPGRAVAGHRDVNCPNRASRLLPPRRSWHRRLRPRSHGRRRRDQGRRRHP